MATARYRGLWTGYARVVEPFQEYELSMAGTATVDGGAYRGGVHLASSILLRRGAVVNSSRFIPNAASPEITVTLPAYKTAVLQIVGDVGRVISMAEMKNYTSRFSRYFPCGYYTHEGTSTIQTW